MAHHSQQDLAEADHPDIEEFFGKDEEVDEPDDLMEEDLGATGEHPDGKMAGHDQGEIKARIFDHKGRVVINFGEVIKSVGLTPEQAKSLGGTLLNRARKAKSDRR